MAGSLADAIRTGTPAAIARVVAGPILVRSDNLVERPWGGHRILDYKGLDRASHGSRRFGEVFEISAFPDDPEARARPSIVRLPDGSELDLPALLEAAAAPILGEALARAYGPRIPLLPKTLDVEGLLSVQAHPPGHPEAYIVLEAEEGATIRLGFRRGVAPGALGARLRQGRLAQEALLDALGPEVEQAALQATLAGLLARRDPGTAEALAAAVAPLLRPDADRDRVTRDLGLLARIYWEVLDLMNEIPVTPGQVIRNATPERHARQPADPAGPTSSAEVHALGNPEGKAILLLEIRRPGPTLRAWDHVRFPLRPIDVEAALAAMSCQATRPEDFLREPRPTGVPGVLRSVETRVFVVDHVCFGHTRFGRLPLAPPHREPGCALLQETAGRFRTLHAIRGSVDITGAAGQVLGRLERGESALIPAALGVYGLVARDSDAELVQVQVP